MLYYAVPTHVGAPQSKMAALAGLCLAYYLHFRYSELTQESTSSAVEPTMTETIKMGKRGTIVIPAPIRRRLGLEEGAIVLAEELEDGVMIRPASVLPTEVYGPRRRAEFLLTNALDAEDYARVRAAVKALGLDPDAIPHQPPGA
jgi:AbrB family looped-hinge helix DNA binding protein